jgi:DHA1 family inner membrane transport protein
VTHSTLFAIAVVVATSLVPKEQAGSAIAKVIIGVNLATVVGVPLGILVADQFGWRATFWCVAGLSAVSTLVAVRTVRDVPAPGSAATELKVLGDRRVLAALAVTGLGMAGAFTAFTYLTTLLGQVTGFRSGTIGVLLLVFGIGSCVGGWVGGKLADRAQMPMTTAVLATLVAVLLALASAAALPWPTVVLIFVFGVVFFALNPLLGSRIITLASDRAPTLAMAVSVSSVQIAIAFGGWFGGRVLDAGFGIRGVVVAAAVVTALGCGLSYVELRRHRRAAGTR